MTGYGCFFFDTALKPPLKKKKPLLKCIYNVRHFVKFVAVASKLRVVAIRIIVGPPAKFQYTRFIGMFTA